MIETRFQQLLRAKINKAKDDREHLLLHGFANDYASYRHDVGHLEGLNETLKFLEEVASDIAKGE